MVLRNAKALSYMLSDSTYSYLDKSERNRPGERWKNIPGFEGYQVSDLGRVRSVDRYVSHKRTGQQFVKGRILSQNLKKHYNRYTKDFIVILQATLMLENIRHDVVVRRLVYGTFKNKNILNSDKRMIVAKDGDGLNNKLSNLVAVSNSERMLMVFSRNRMPMVLAEMDHTKFKPTFSLWKPVHRCNANGKVLETFPCISHASKKGFLEKGIIEAAKGRIKFYKGYKWRYASRKFLDSFKKDWKILSAPRHSSINQSRNAFK